MLALKSLRYLENRFSHWLLRAWSTRTFLSPHLVLGTVLSSCLHTLRTYIIPLSSKKPQPPERRLRTFLLSWILLRLLPHVADHTFIPHAQPDGLFPLGFRRGIEVLV